MLVKEPALISMISFINPVNNKAMQDSVIMATFGCKNDSFESLVSIEVLDGSMDQIFISTDPNQITRLVFSRRNLERLSNGSREVSKRKSPDFLFTSYHYHISQWKVNMMFAQAELIIKKKLIEYSVQMVDKFINRMNEDSTDGILVTSAEDFHDIDDPAQDLGDEPDDDTKPGNKLLRDDDDYGVGMPYDPYSGNSQEEWGYCSACQEDPCMCSDPW